MSTKKLEALKTIAAGFNMLYEAELEAATTKVASATPAEENSAQKLVEEEKTLASVAPASTQKKEVKETTAPPKEKEKLAEEAPKKDFPAKEEEKPVEETKKGDDLESMNMTELKALAKDMGIRVNFVNRAKLIELVRAKITEENKKLAAEKKEELPEDALMKRLREETEEMSDDEIRELLEEADISEKGGRTALLAKLHEAVKNGVISFDDGEDTVTEEDGEDALVSDDDEQEEQDTPERVKAIEIFDSQNREAFERGELDVGAMKDFLKENFNFTLPKKATPAEVLDSYIEHAINFIDDDGNTVEEGAYSVRGVPYCCGVPLEIKKNKRGETIGKCNICSETYKIEEE